jgi:6-phosphogluconolactonase (cycloisomerase 2 family)
VGTDNVSSLSTLPTATCSADAASPAGDYVVTVSGGNDKNYTFANTNGKLTVKVNTAVQTQSVSDLHLYPNPTSGWVYIDLTVNTVDAIVEVFNSSGMKIQSVKESGQKISLDLGNHPNGIYLIRIIAGKNVVSKIVLKN